MLTKNLYVGMFFVFLLGFSHPGKNIVALNFSIEQFPKEVRDNVVGWALGFENFWIIPITLIYRYIDRSWKTLQIAGFLVSVLCLITIVKYEEESPKYFYNNK